MESLFGNFVFRQERGRWERIFPALRGRRDREQEDTPPTFKNRGVARKFTKARMNSRATGRDDDLFSDAN